MSGDLSAYGWNRSFAATFAAEAPAGTKPARVFSVQHGFYRLQTAEGRYEGVLAGSLRYHAEGAAELPVVGDWVAARMPPGAPAVIETVLPRASRISRKAAGRRAVEQVMAANVDVVFLVMGLDADFNVRRLERFGAVARETGARPVVLLNKADLAVDVELLRSQAAAALPGVTVLAVSARQGGLAPVEELLTRGVTAVLLGSSGVGKSTLTNRLLGEEAFATGSVRARDGRGRHTTTNRQLVQLPSGGLLIDGPGIREVQPWSDEGLGETFGDLQELTVGCRFRDCGHGDEPGCAVRAAVAAGALDARRVASFLALEQEAATLARRRNERQRRAAERQQGKIFKQILADKRRRKD